MKIIFTISAFLITLIAFGQSPYSNIYSKKRDNRSDLEKLQELNNFYENKRNDEIKYQDAVFSYRNEVFNEIKMYSRLLSNENYKYIINQEKTNWNFITNNMKHYNSYKSYYLQNRNSLENYKNSMLRILDRLTRQ